MRCRICLVFSVLAALIAVSCVTINVYFPEAAVQDLSERIEDAVTEEAEALLETEEGEDATEPVESGAGSTSAASVTLFERTIGLALSLLPAPTALAQEQVAAPEITNPAIRQIVQSRAARLQEIRKRKADQTIGETSEALLAIRNLDSLPLQERAMVQKLVREENADRERMFKEIAAATGTDLSQLPQIKTTYAETIRSKAESGDWLQSPDGSWSRKSGG